MRRFLVTEVTFLVKYLLSCWIKCTNSSTLPCMCVHLSSVYECMTPNSEYVEPALHGARCVLVCVSVCCNLSSRSCFPGLRWGKAALAAGRFISGTGAQNKEKMIDWMMNYLEVEGWGTKQPRWRERERGIERVRKQASECEFGFPLSLSLLVGDGNPSKNLALIVLMRVTANLPK